MPNCNTCSTPLLVGKNWTKAQQQKKTYKCNDCRAEYQREYHKRNKEQQNARSKRNYEKNKDKILEQQKFRTIERQYGLTKEQYLELMIDASCSICHSKEDLVIDHCHDSGHIRGVLCRKCNCAIGLLGDNVNMDKPLWSI